MNTSYIPEKTFNKSVSQGEVLEIDTKGLDVRLCALTGDVLVKVKKNSEDADAFELSEGRELFFSGKVFVKAKTQAKITGIMFSKL